MKLRPGLLIGALLIMLTMNSCIHDYTCECVITYSGQPGLPDTLTRDYSISDKKKDAEKTCEQNSTTSDKDGVHTVEDCHLY
jgi:hypothetical protein